MDPSSSRNPSALWLCDVSLWTEPSETDMREAVLRQADEMARLREENRMVRERMDMLENANRIQARSLHQMQLLSDNGLLNSFPNISNNSRQAQAPEPDIIKVRVSVITRMDCQMMDDGCEWVNYALSATDELTYSGVYYHCAVPDICPAWKKMQKCEEDPSILITTYQGEHNHPLDHVANAMFSNITLAAKMFVYGFMPTTEKMPWDIPPFFPQGMAYVSYSDENPTVVLDMSNPSSSSGELPQRNLRIAESDRGALMP